MIAGGPGPGSWTTSGGCQCICREIASARGHMIAVVRRGFRGSSCTCAGTTSSPNERSTGTVKPSTCPCC